MQKITRRAAVLGLAMLPAVSNAAAAAPEQLVVKTDEGDMELSRIGADGAARRPAVLLLHGRRGFEMKPAAYERHANALKAAGIDCYLVRYMTEADTRILSSGTKPERKAAGRARARPDNSESGIVQAACDLARPVIAAVINKDDPHRAWILLLQQGAQRGPDHGFFVPRRDDHGNRRRRG